MSLSQKIIAPLALAFTVSAGAALADTANDNNHTFSCDMPGASQLLPSELAALDLVDRMEEVMPANVFIQTSSPNSPGGGLGSGFIVDGEEGYILTNNHVIMGGAGAPAETITITFRDPNKPDHLGQSVEATLIGRDADLDLAVLQVEMDDVLPCVQLGDSDSLRTFDSVYAVGNPLGKTFSGSAGIVSMTDREVGNRFYSMIQTDAAVNQGNSGGALFNDNGEVIGINTAIITPTILMPGGRTGPAGNLGIAYTIKSNDVAEVAGDLILWGETRRAGLGVQVQEVTADIAASMNVEEGVGALLTNVAPDRPAALGGLEEGDIILSIDGDDIYSTVELVRKIASYDPDDQVSMTIMRDGVEQVMDITLTDRENALQPIENDVDEDVAPEVTPSPFIEP